MNGLTKQRYISTSFWSDEWVETLTIQEKLLYMYLLTNELTNIAGIYEISIKRMKDDTGLPREDVIAGLEKFSLDKKAFYIDRHIIIPKWPKHQKLGERGKLKLGAEAVLKSLPEEIKRFIKIPGNYCYDLSFLECGEAIQPMPCQGNGQSADGPSPESDRLYMPYRDIDENGDTLSIGYPYPIDTLSIPYGYPMDTLSHDSDSDLDNIADQNSMINKQLNLQSVFSKNENPGDPQSFPTAIAVETEEAAKPISAIAAKEQPLQARSRSPPKKSSKQELTQEQLILFHAAKACFESSERTKEIMYQDRQTAAREMAHLKTLAIRCGNIAPGMTAEFLKAVLEHFRVLVNGRLKGKAAFTPRSLITPWVWETVIFSLPEPDDELSAGIRESIKGMFK